MLESILNIFRFKPIKTIHEKRIECEEQPIANTKESMPFERLAEVKIQSVETKPDHLDFCKVCTTI